MYRFAVRSDDFDMAKLQRSLKQRQRHARRHSANVSKLTPAEIRSLNNQGMESKTGSQSSSHSASPINARRPTTITPPTTPDKASAYQAQSHRKSVSRNPVVDVPTPPHTPNGQRRSSQSSTRSHSHGHRSGQDHGDGTTHAPRSKCSAHSAFVAANGLSPRPSSSGSSIYRGLPTYRGPEVTRNASFNMLQRPSPTIVTNPLSYFSRPRQSVSSTSPERSRSSQEMSTYRAQSLRNERDNSISNISATSSGPPSPHRLTESPVSLVANNTEKFTVLGPADDPHNQPKDQSDDEIPATVAQPDHGSREYEEPAPPLPTQNVADQGGKPTKEKKRFTLFGTDKGAQDKAEDTNKLKKTRTKSLPLVNGEDEKSPEAKQTLSKAQTAAPDQESHVDGAIIEEGGFKAQPAVRSLSLPIPGEFKGKEKEIHCPPVYARCACCGKLKRPPGASGGLSPVMEDENLRTKFSFEIERTSGDPVVGSSGSSQGHSTLIIPMEVHKDETCQASIQPLTASTNPAQQQRQMNSPNLTSWKTNHPAGSPAKFVRFASLHGRRNGDNEEEEEAELVNDTPLTSEQPQTHVAEVKTHDFAASIETAESRPIPESQTNPPIAVPRVDDQHIRPQVTDPAPEATSITGPEADIFFTPVTEKSTPEEEGQHKTQGTFLLTLPVPSLGPHFTRSSASLRDYVIRAGSIRVVDDREEIQELSKPVIRKPVPTDKAVSARVDEVLGLDPQNPADQKWLAEVMAL